MYIYYQACVTREVRKIPETREEDKERYQKNENDKMKGNQRKLDMIWESDHGGVR